MSKFNEARISGCNILISILLIITAILILIAIIKMIIIIILREESSGNNERIGQYSYIDDTGKTITVKYSAGVNGFR